MAPKKEPFLSRRLPLPVVGLILVAALGAAVALAQVVPKKESPTPTPTPTVTPCQEAAKPYGDPPDGFTYAPVDEPARVKTVKALRLDEAEGKVDMRKATRGGVTLGTIVGVPSKDPAEYAANLVAAAQHGGADVSRGKGYAIIPLDNGQDVAVGVRGCRTILVNSSDPEGARYLAAVIFGG